MLDIDKDKMLPLAHILGGSVLNAFGPTLSPTYTLGWEQGVECQRNADWERVKKSVEESKKMLLVVKTSGWFYYKAYQPLEDALNGGGVEVERF